MSLKDRVEEWWITSEFSISKNQLIASIILAVAILAGWLVYYLGQSPAQTPIEVTEKQPTRKKEINRELFIHVAGAVKKPGVYVLKEGSRAIEAIEKAGGFTKDANQDSLNLAAKVSDSQKIIVETKNQATGIPARSSMPGEGKINLNTATEDQLDELPGIGEVMAKRILEYRTEIGFFKSVDQLKDIEGIGPKKFDRLKDKVTL